MVRKNQNDNKKIAVLQVLPAMMSGGVERAVLDTANMLIKAGHKSYVASSGGRLVSQLYQNGSRHFVLPLNSKNPFVIIKNIFALKNLIKLYDIDIIHAQSRAPAWSAYFAAKLTNCHFVTTIHGAHGVTNAIKRFYNSVMTKAEKVIVVSEFIEKYAKKNYQFDYKKLKIIHCGTDTEKFDPEKVSEKRIVELARSLHIPTDKPIIMMPSRFTRQKGHLFLIEAIKLLPPKSITCLLVGDYGVRLQYREELIKKINEYGLKKTVIMTGNISDMPAAYALTDIVVCPSVKPEAFGLIVTEAQAMGRLVIATGIGGASETIINEKTGWQVKPNDPEELAGTIDQVLQMSLEERLEYGKLAREHVEKNFSLANAGKKLIKIYLDIVNNN